MGVYNLILPTVVIALSAFAGPIAAQSSNTTACNRTTFSTTTTTTTATTTTTTTTTRVISTTTIFHSTTPNLPETSTEPTTTDATTKPPCSCPVSDRQCPCSGVVEVRRLLSFRDCRGIQDGIIYTDARHCRRFYVCRNNRVRRQICPAGQWFDRSTLACHARMQVTNCLVRRN